MRMTESGQPWLTETGPQAPVLPVVAPKSSAQCRAEAAEYVRKEEIEALRRELGAALGWVQFPASDFQAREGARRVKRAQAQLVELGADFSSVSAEKLRTPTKKSGGKPAVGGRAEGALLKAIFG